MFERYSDNARRAVNNARQVANQHGSRFIDSEHLLLGILLEEQAPAIQIDGGLVPVQTLRDEVRAEMSDGPEATEQREVLLSADCKQILHLAAEEAKQLGYRRIAAGHFLLGILKHEDCTAARILHHYGGTITAMRMEAARWAG